MPRLLWENLDDNDEKEYLEKWKDISQNQYNKSNLERNINLIESLQCFPDDEVVYQTGNINTLRVKTLMFLLRIYQKMLRNQPNLLLYMNIILNKAVMRVRSQLTSFKSPRFLTLVNPNLTP